MMRELTLVRGSFDDWYVIEWAEHEHRDWMEEIDSNTFSYQWSGRPSDADIEGTASEMLVIATAIEERTNASFRRCAAHFVQNGYLISSPRNSREPAKITLEQADHLAKEIRRVLKDVNVNDVG